jgi:SAM-dependent methyltransferase
MPQGTQKEASPEALAKAQHPSLRDIIGWDVLNWSRALELWSVALSSRSKNVYCLELGCGRNSSLALWLAALGNRVVCSDREGVSEPIRAAHARYSLAQRISYASVDARAIPYRSEFDVVIFKSILGGIVARDDLSVAADVLAGIYAALKPGGLLLFAENLYATPVHEFTRARFGAGKDGWRYFALDELRSLMSAFANVQIDTWGFLACFGRSEGQRQVLGKLDGLVAEKLVPASWHYIAAVVAEKPQASTSLS